MYDYDKNSMYDHNRAVVQHIRGLCEYGERVCLKHGYQIGTYRPYYLQREFNIPRKVKKGD